MPDRSPAVAPTPHFARGATRAAVALALLAAAAACGRAPSEVAPPPEPVSYAAHPGFDTYQYPGDLLLRAWRPPASPYRWIGFYLPAPCHRETSWSGKRQAITDLGYGIAVLYVGQQTWEGQASLARPDGPRPEPVRADSVRADSARADSVRADSVPAVPAAADTLAANAARAAALPPTCSRTLLTEERGLADAADAVARAAAEGFAPGTVIFLDVERMETIPAEMHAYYRAWLRGVAADGRFRPGVYSHARNAAELRAAAREELAGTGGTEPGGGATAAEPPFWIASQVGFHVTRRPEDSGHPFAHVWQGALDVTETWGGMTLRVDANVARTPSPSAAP